MQCPKCGKQISNTATFCGYCGETIREHNTSEGAIHADPPPAKSGNTKNNFVIALICLIVAVIVGVGAFFIAKNVFKDEPIAINQSGEVKEVEVQDDETETEISFIEDAEVDDVEENIAENDIVDETQEKETPKTSTVKTKSNSFSASSTLPNEGTLTYYPKNAFDGDITTAWVEGVSGNGIGECLSVSFEESVNIQAFGFDNGYSKSENLYYKNSRPKQLKFIFETEYGTEETNFSFDDKYDGDFFFHYANSFKQVKKINIFIEDVYAGSKYEDTCITDIFFYDENMQIIDLQ